MKANEHQETTRIPGPSVEGRAVDIAMAVLHEREIAAVVQGAGDAIASPWFDFIADGASLGGRISNEEVAEAFADLASRADAPPAEKDTRFRRPDFGGSGGTRWKWESGPWAPCRNCGLPTRAVIVLDSVTVHLHLRCDTILGRSERGEPNRHDRRRMAAPRPPIDPDVYENETGSLTLVGGVAAAGKAVGFGQKCRCSHPYHRSTP